LCTVVLAVLVGNVACTPAGESDGETVVGDVDGTQGVPAAAGGTSDADAPTTGDILSSDSTIDAVVALDADAGEQDVDESLVDRDVTSRDTGPSNPLQFCVHPENPVALAELVVGAEQGTSVATGVVGGEMQTLHASLQTGRVCRVVWRDVASAVCGVAPTVAACSEPGLARVVVPVPSLTGGDDTFVGYWADERVGRRFVRFTSDFDVLWDVPAFDSGEMGIQRFSTQEVVSLVTTDLDLDGVPEVLASFAGTPELAAVSTGTGAAVEPPTVVGRGSFFPTVTPILARTIVDGHLHVRRALLSTGDAQTLMAATPRAFGLNAPLHSGGLVGYRAPSVGEERRFYEPLAFEPANGILHGSFMGVGVLPGQPESRYVLFDVGSNRPIRVDLSARTSTGFAAVDLFGEFEAPDSDVAADRLGGGALLEPLYAALSKASDGILSPETIASLKAAGTEVQFTWGSVLWDADGDGLLDELEFNGSVGTVESRAAAAIDPITSVVGLMHRLRPVFRAGRAGGATEVDVGLGMYSSVGMYCASWPSSPFCEYGDPPSRTDVQLGERGGVLIPCGSELCVVTSSGHTGVGAIYTIADQGHCLVRLAMRYAHGAALEFRDGALIERLPTVQVYAGSAVEFAVHPGSGHVMFPSGWIAAYDCDATEDVIVLTEPEWVTLERVADGVALGWAGNDAISRVGRVCVWRDGCDNAPTDCLPVPSEQREVTVVADPGACAQLLDVETRIPSLAVHEAVLEVGAARFRLP
jgi:hypothetical protein